MTDRATSFIDRTLKGVADVEGRVYFGGPPQEGARNPCVIYAITDDTKYPTLSNPDRVISVDYEVSVRSNDGSEVERLGNKVWAALAARRPRVREIGGYTVGKYVASDGSEETEAEFFATREYRVRVK